MEHKEDIRHTNGKHGTPAIEVADLLIQYNQEIILENLNFEIEAGTITAIIGPNGAGKTTLLRAMLGLIPVNGGSVKFFGMAHKKKCHHLSGHHPDCVLHPAYVPQRFAFDRTFPLTVYEFLKLLPPSPKHTIHDVLQEVDMVGSEAKLLGHLSGGELQRVLIARAILQESSMMFLDEPVFGIDIAGAKTFYDLIRFLNRKHGVTIVLVSHEIDIVHKYADFVICLNKEMVCHGPPKEMLTAETLNNLYGKEVMLYEHKK